MTKSLKVHFLPTLVTPQELRDNTVVVIDVLRASTTIVCAMAAGAREILPCLEIGEARKAAAETGSDMLTGGERGGRKIDGFDLGNSPVEYAREHVLDKRIAFTTTNGTKAMMRCREARRVLVGAFVNLSAVCDELRSADNVALVCAGTDGQITREDVLFAGAVASKLRSFANETVVANDEGRVAIAAWGTVAAARLAEVLRDTLGGENLIAIGQEHDIEIAARVDAHNIVPELRLDRWRIYLP